MTQASEPHKRRHFYVKKGFQAVFILRFCILVLIGVLVSTGLVFLFSQNTLTTSFHQSRLEIQSTGKAILPTVIYTNLLTLGLITAATVVVVLFVSHRIAGPLYRFEKEVARIRDGDLTTRIRLRSRDQMTDMARCLNEMTVGLREKILAIQNELDELIRANEGGRTPKELEERLLDLSNRISTYFKL